MVGGFFSSQETQSKTRPDGKSYTCVSCGLIKRSKSPRMKPWGNFSKKIMNIGPGMSSADDAAGASFSDAYGRYVTKAYKRLGVNLSEDCLNLQAVNCACVDEDGNDKTPTDYEISCCRRSIMKYIDQYQPKVIIVFGETALKSLIGHRWQKDFGGIHKWRGYCIPDQDLKAWICPVYSPKFVSEAKGDEVRTIWEQDLSRALSMEGVKFPKNKKPTIDLVDDLRILESAVKKGDLVAIDYETTGLKPHGAGQRIVSASIAPSNDYVMAFLMPETKSERAPWVNVLKDGSVAKTAQNMKFEEQWSAVRLRQPVNGWIWDTMLATHLLDNRTGVTGLKFQTYVHFGVVDYDSDVSPYLRSKDDAAGGNGLNRIMELISTESGKIKLLTYNAWDSIWERRLMEIQTKMMDFPFLPF